MNDKFYTFNEVRNIELENRARVDHAKYNVQNMIFKSVSGFIIGEVCVYTSDLIHNVVYDSVLLLIKNRFFKHPRIDKRSYVNKKQKKELLKELIK